MKKILCITFLALSTLAISLSAQTHIEGYLYEDINQNGLRDRNEKGIAQVAVSNGREVTLTDGNGKYRLPTDGNSTVFVIKPSGYSLPLDTFQLLKAYYRHKPAGSPPSFYPGVKPSGKLPASVDFALYKYDEPEAFTALLFGDTQPYSEQELDYMKRGIIAEVAPNREPLFGITLGDLVGDRLDLHHPYKQAISHLRLPWYNVMGNHDMNYDASEDVFSDETFEANFGPNNYAFNYGRAHFIVLDDILYPHPLTGRGYWGGLRDDQFTFVKNDLRAVPHNHLIVIAMHIPLLESGAEDAFRTADRQRLFFLLKDYPQVLFLSAHTHFQTQNVFGKEQGLDREIPIHEYNVGTTCGDWYSGVLSDKDLPVSTMRDGTPAGYAFLRIDGDRYVLDYKALGRPETAQIALHHPKAVPVRSSGAAVYANFFMGSATDTVEYRIGDGPWSMMQRVSEWDPAYARAAQDWDYWEDLPAGRRPSNPVICSHLWKARLTSNLPIGEYRIEIRAKDRFQRLHSAAGFYKVK